MTMPVNLVLVRHGQSEQNVAIRQAEQGNADLYEVAGFIDTHGSRYRLTGKGREQAARAGQWLRDNDLDYFDRRYTSQYTRAVETAALLGINGPDWYIDAMLREREWGQLETMDWNKVSEYLDNPHYHTEPFYWCPPDGESIAGLVLRLRLVLDILHRECSDKNVIIVAHGEVIWTFRYMLERMTVDSWAELDKSDEPGVHIDNGQIIHYSRRDPSSGAISPHLDWVRSISPTNLKNSHDWKPVHRPTFSDEALLRMAQRSPRFFEEL